MEGMCGSGYARIWRLGTQVGLGKGPPIRVTGMFERESRAGESDGLRRALPAGVAGESPDDRVRR